MASSPDPAEIPPPEDQEVRWPLVAKIGLVLAAITVVVAVVAALVAAFVVERDDRSMARTPTDAVWTG